MPDRKVTVSSAEKKPSLASFMPDKTQGIAEKKRAIKRIVATASKKVPAKKRVQETVQPKKSSKTARKTSKATVSVKSFPKKALAVDTVIQLPTSVSMRAKEKSLVLLQALIRDFHIPAQKVALVSGMCFITFGGYMALAFSGALPQSITPQVAQLTSAGIGSEPTPTASVAHPTFTLLEPIPAHISGVGNFTISVTNAKTVSVYLYSLETGTEQDIAVDMLVEGTYRFIIDANNLESGDYVIKTSVASALDDSTYSFKVGEFEVKPEVEVLESPTTASSTTNSKPVSAETTTAVASSTHTTEEESHTVKEVETLTVETLSTEFSGRTVLKAYAPSSARSVEFYVRPITSTQLRFLGMAEKRNDYWQYLFNSTNLPNGTYEFIAKTRISNNILESNTTIVTISNYVAVPAQEPTEDSVEQPLSLQDTTVHESKNSRSFFEYTLYEAGAQNPSSTIELSTSVDVVLEGYKDELQTLLDRYAVAQQSGNELLIKIAKTELQDAKTRLVAEVLANPDLSMLGDDIDAALSARFEELQKRIETFEEFRRVASEESSSADTDLDGVSDFDEFNMYRTNAEEPDSDNDGVTDGVEIMRGYNPLDAVAEAVIVYEMPQETHGLVENELLKVESVSPFIKTEDPTVAPVVHASIKGTGLPNSYVTMYVFSTPTIVTVRTDQDGSFEYTFEKELEDGEHEVYVAVTDNTGVIMARSKPFRFIKEAQAFTSIDAAGGTISQSEISLFDLQASDSYNIAIGLGILALGIILLILGSGLRERNFIKVTSTSDDVHVI